MLHRKWRGWMAGLAVGMVVVVAGFWIWVRREAGPVAEGDFGDGRVFIVEEVSFGRKHEVGRDLGALERFRAWWPGQFWDVISPKRPKTKIEEEEPALVVWLRAEDSITRTNRDAQGVWLQLVDS